MKKYHRKIMMSAWLKWMITKKHVKTLWIAYKKRKK